MSARSFHLPVDYSSRIFRAFSNYTIDTITDSIDFGNVISSTKRLEVTLAFYHRIESISGLDQ